MIKSDIEHSSIVELDLCQAIVLPPFQVDGTHALHFRLERNSSNEKTKPAEITEVLPPCVHTCVRIRIGCLR